MHLIQFQELEDKIQENNLEIAQFKEAVERHRSTHEMLVFRDQFCNDHCIPEVMKQFMVKNAAKALQSVRDHTAAYKIRESENEELLMAVAERRLNGMKVDSKPKDAAHGQCLLDASWKVAEDDHSKCL